MFQALLSAGARVAKALTAGLTAAGGVYLASTGGGVTQAEWIQITGTAVVIAFLTWLVPNKKPSPA